MRWDLKKQYPKNRVLQGRIIHDSFRTKLFEIRQFHSGGGMEANGVNLGEMNMLLKIGELMLYVMDLMKENEELKKRK